MCHNLSLSYCLPSLMNVGMLAFKYITCLAAVNMFSLTKLPVHILYYHLWLCTLTSHR